MMPEFAGTFLLLVLNYVDTTPFYRDFVTSFEYVFVGKIVCIEECIEASV